MIKYFKDTIKKVNTLYIIVDDKNYDYNIGIKIDYDNKNKIKNVLLLNKNECLNFLKKTIYAIKEIDEFELMFDNQYLELLKDALNFHNKKYNFETILNKVVKKYNILNINES